MGRRPVWLTEEQARDLAEYLAWVEKMEEAGRMTLGEPCAAAFAAMRPQLDKIAEGRADNEEVTA